MRALLFALLIAFIVSVIIYPITGLGAAIARKYNNEKRTLDKKFKKIK